jgi:hypothetical protein
MDLTAACCLFNKPLNLHALETIHHYYLLLLLQVCCVFVFQ